MTLYNYTQEQIDRANSIDIRWFLERRGETLIRSGKEFRWKAHDSVTINGNKWFRHSQSKGGYPIDFVMEFYGVTFPKAMEMLLYEFGEGRKYSPKAPTLEFKLPKHSETNDNAIKYLTESRGLSNELVTAFVDSGNVYEDDEHHNVVFVGRDGNNIPRYASVRGTKEKFRQDISGSDKAYSFSYLSDGTQLFVFEAPIDLLSFIQLFPKDWHIRNYCSLGGVSGKALERILSEHKDINHVFLCLDNDDAGNEASVRLAEDISENITVTRLIPARKDWNDVLREKDAIESRRFITETVVLKEGNTEEPVSVIRMSEVTQEEVKWLWYPYLPFGKLTLLQGNPGEGKTYFAMELAAACTSGNPLPGMELLDPFNVIYQTAEDGLGDTIRPRLDEAGADLARVLVINDTNNPLSLSDDRIEKAVKQNHARLLVIDPVQAFMGSSVDMNRANEVRPILRKLGDMAQRTGCAVILIGHLNKSSGSQSTYRGLGSIDITAAVRSVLLIGRVKKDPNIRVICHDKSSLAPEGDSMAFSLNTENGFEWIGEYEITADDLLCGKSNNGETDVLTKQAQARQIILELLSSAGEVSSDELDRIAGEEGISKRTVRLAKAELRDNGLLGSRKSGTQWYHFLEQSEARLN